MMYRAFSRPIRLLADAAIGLALFLFTAGLLAGTCDGRVHMSDLYTGQAHAAHIVGDPSWMFQASPSSTVPLAMVKSYPGQVFRGTDRTTAFVVLGTVFTLLFVANLALYRHLRNEYRPRRRRRSKSLLAVD